MLTTFEKSDIDTISEEVAKKLKLILKTSEKTPANDFIFDVKQLSKYLNVPESCDLAPKSWATFCDRIEQTERGKNGKKIQSRRNRYEIKRNRAFY